ncbi:hypothetical protein MHPYR_430038 [uncultured Mycobacterium sp.]|uniref:Uncharacterized protein n=1 Tax=uncultured Mycobacterium sp. TaxID=171292 RepID=A0A1Y5PJG4_9MYCO|nr:hypothetical protein MHPYR_430038 [uncultured Mycobacterium sp.]
MWSPWPGPVSALVDRFDLHDRWRGHVVCPQDGRSVLGCQGLAYRGQRPPLVGTVDSKPALQDAVHTGDERDRGELNRQPRQHHDLAERPGRVVHQLVDQQCDDTQPDTGPHQRRNGIAAQRLGDQPRDPRPQRPARRPADRKQRRHNENQHHLHLGDPGLGLTPQHPRQYGVVVRIGHGHGLDSLALADETSELFSAATLNQRIALPERDPFATDVVEPVGVHVVGHVLSLKPPKQVPVHYFWRSSDSRGGVNRRRSRRRRRAQVAAERRRAAGAPAAMLSGDGAALLEARRDI